jgi:hypothetical protein
MSAFDVHQDSMARYLVWLSSAGGESDEDSQALVPTFTWKNQDYACNYSLVKQHDLGPGGSIPMDDLILEVLEPMEETPEPEQMLTLNDSEFRIRSVHLAPGKNPRLVCYDPARGA